MELDVALVVNSDQRGPTQNSLPQLTAYGMLLQSIFATCDWDTSNARPPVGLCVRGL